MLHAMSSSKEKLSKLSKAVSNLDPNAVVKASWHVQCSCGTAMKLNHEFSTLSKYIMYGLDSKHYETGSTPTTKVLTLTDSGSTLYIALSHLEKTFSTLWD